MAGSNDKLTTLYELIRPIGGLDKNQTGYAYRRGWNDAIRHVMDLERAGAFSKDQKEPS